MKEVFSESIEKFFKERKIIDLTVTIADDFPSYTAFGVPFIMVQHDFYDSIKNSDYGPYFDHVIIMNEHTGTHCDAPCHMIPDIEKYPDIPHAGVAGKITTEKIPVKQTMGPAAVIDVTDLIGTGAPGISPIIKVERVKQWEEKNGELKIGDIVLFYTSWTDRYYKKFPEGYKLDRDCRLLKKSEGWPAPDAETMNYLVEKGIKHVGVDTVSTGSIQDDNTPHWAGLSKGLVFTEKLTRLGELPPRGAYYIFLPLKIRGGSGGPGRAIAIL